MGYEILFHYYDRNADGPGYNVSEIKQLKRKLGNTTDDIPSEKLAAAIMGQMARRDIMVQDVEVYEYTKKKVSFKETKGGVIIGNRKYLFDDCDTMTFTEIQENVPALPAPVATPAVKSTVKSNQIQLSEEELAGGENLGDKLYFKMKRPIRKEMFAPDKAYLSLARSQNLSLTIGRVYDIYDEKIAPGDNIMAGMIYTVCDDRGRRQLVSDKFFNVVPNLFAGDLFNEDLLSTINNGDMVDNSMPMPVLRGGQR